MLKGRTRTLLIEGAISRWLRTQDNLIGGSCVKSMASLSTYRPACSDTRRHFSDRLLGYSPMAPATSVPSVSGKKIPTAQDVTTAGGVWAPTSAKRDKLTELKIELKDGQESLTDVATPEQRLDIFLAEGILLIAKVSDLVPEQDSEILQKFADWLESQSSHLPADLDEVQMNVYLDRVSEFLSSLLSSLPGDRVLREVRDFCDAGEISNDDLQRMKPSDVGIHDSVFAEAVTRFRLQLTLAAVETMKSSWKALTTVTDADLDRAAVKGEAIEREAKTVSLPKLSAVFLAHATGTCSQRVDTFWSLLDCDGDGLLDEYEMNQVVFLALKPMQMGLVNLFGDALDAYPVRAPLSDLGSDQIPVPKGWRERRNEANIKKRLMKMFQKTCRNHFEDEVEINHRLRCIYAWAEKAHQENKLDSVLVDQGWSGRKRYVELKPKISLEEFREVQQEHFTHLDRMGNEILKSFREDLWVAQGKGRQNRDLARDCLIFLCAVSIVDYLVIVA